MIFFILGTETWPTFFPFSLSSICSAGRICTPRFLCPCTFRGEPWAGGCCCEPAALQVDDLKGSGVSNRFVKILARWEAVAYEPGSVILRCLSGLSMGVTAWLIARYHLSPYVFDNHYTEKLGFAESKTYGKAALAGIPTMLTASHTRERRLTSLACHLAWWKGKASASKCDGMVSAIPGREGDYSRVKASDWTCWSCSRGSLLFYWVVS